MEGLKQEFDHSSVLAMVLVTIVFVLDQRYAYITLHSYGGL